MLSARPKVLESVLGLVIVALLAFLIAPWRQQALPRAPAAGAASSAAPLAALPAAANLASPESILPIFIGRPIASGPAPTPPPLDAPWLQYLGHSSALDGSVTWYVKDTRSGKIIRASKTQGADGWTVVEEKDTSLLLKNAGQVYSVVKK